jgi:hypothetical protein
VRLSGPALFDAEKDRSSSQWKVLDDNLFVKTIGYQDALLLFFRRALPVFNMKTGRTLLCFKGERVNLRYR